MTLLALLWWLVLEARGAGRRSNGRVGSLALIAVPLLIAQIGLGALAHATFGSASCPTLAGCAASDWLPQLSAAAFDPFRPAAGVAGHSLPHADAAAVHMTHRAFALVVTAWVLMVRWNAWRIPAPRARGMAPAAARCCRLLRALLVCAIAASAALVHNVAASLLLAALVQVVWRLRAVP